MLESSFNLKKRITDVLVALKNSAEDKKTKLHLEFDGGIPRKLKGDPLKISQILDQPHWELYQIYRRRRYLGTG